MENPLDRIVLNAEYVAGPILSTDFVAGGVFICVPYEVILIFRPNNAAELKKRIVENFRPLDNEEEEIGNFHLEGSYDLTDRNYICCSFQKHIFVRESDRFEEKLMEFQLIGLPLKQNPHILALDSPWKTGFVLSK